MGFLLHPALLYGRLGFVGILFLQYAFCFLLLATLTQFVKFHIKVCSLLPNLLNFALQLVSDNFTTIENLLLWWLPMHTALTRPAGDGVRWRVHYTRVVSNQFSCMTDFFFF
eukprot:Filipodium_phascolosomae@DN2489_c0_g1_i5.p1